MHDDTCQSMMIHLFPLGSFLIFCPIEIISSIILIVIINFIFILIFVIIFIVVLFVCLLKKFLWNLFWTWNSLFITFFLFSNNPYRLSISLYGYSLIRPNDSSLSSRSTPLPFTTATKRERKKLKNKKIKK